MGKPRPNFSRFIVSLISDDSGQGTVEYILILSAAVVGAASVVRSVMGVVDTGILRLGSQLEQDLKTGRAPIDIWQN